LGSTWFNHPARSRTHSAIPAKLVIPTNLANTIKVKINALL
jgi:hypothetical protein